MSNAFSEKILKVLRSMFSHNLQILFFGDVQVFLSSIHLLKDFSS